MKKAYGSVVLVFFLVLGCQTVQQSVRERGCGNQTLAAEQLCNDLIRERTAIYDKVALERKPSQSTDRKLTRQARLEELLNEVPRITAAARGPIPKYLCRVEWRRTVRCVPFNKHLAIYDTEMAKAMLQDTERLYKLKNLKPEHTTLIACENGLWAAAEPIEADNGTIASADVAKLLEQCALAAEAAAAELAESGGALDSLNGFSGITGISPAGPLSVCGLSVPSQTDFAQTVDTLLAMQEEYMKQCTVEGPGGGLLPPPPNIPGCTVGPDGMVCDIDPGVRGAAEQKTTTTTKYNGTTTTTTNTTFADGTIVTGSMTVDSDGYTVSTETTIEYADGSSVHSLHETGVFIGLDLNDNEIIIERTITTWTEANGDAFTEIIVTFPSGRQEISGWKTVGNNYYNCDEGICTQLIPIPDGDCAMDVVACKACSDFREFIPKVLDDCLFTQSKSYACQRFIQQVQCCQNKDVFSGDPRILIPNPIGELICAAGLDYDIAEELCNRKCSVAYHDDCNRICLASLGERKLGALEPDLLNVSCGPYAYSVDCPLGGEDITEADVPNPCPDPRGCLNWQPDPPQPPEDISRHIVF